MFKHLSSDFLASVVVFLVALPLCMGISIASGVPATYGLITGIIGGILVGFITGSPLQVSGPAAGLSVLVWELVTQYGIEKLGIIVLLAGAIQAIAAFLKLGNWFRAVSPAVIQGMLAGIGVLIIGSQFHILFDQKPQGSGLANLTQIPSRLQDAFINDTYLMVPFAIGVLTIVATILWNNFKPAKLKAVPGALVGVLVGTATVAALELPVKLVEIPNNILGTLSFSHLFDFSFSTQTLALIIPALSLAFIASAESLLCAAAVDQMSKGPRTQYNKELLAQGVGNFISGVFGVLPMTGVIVRSAANVESGGKTKLSTILHGAWILLFVIFFPNVLGLIPMAALAGILCFTGFKLLNINAVKSLKKHGSFEVLVYSLTLGGIVIGNLLTGVILGLCVALLKAALKQKKFETQVSENEEETLIKFEGHATFVIIPLIAKTIEQASKDKKIRIDVKNLKYTDHACKDLFKSYGADL